ncbi:DUF4365 domain-containing protein [Paraburkholderia unamae]|uniref:DUF4365 domain-containing protein n=1 Tax=Paraburkholderia unamae TaxID=219649 RepID=A0ACC6RXQ3_9BURK
MTDERFRYDVFVGFADGDEAVIEDVSQSLRSAGLSVWSSQPISARVAESGATPDDAHEALRAMTQSRVLVLFITSFATDLHVRRFEEISLRFRDPANPRRRFVPVRVDAIPWPDALRNIEHIEWVQEDRFAVIERIVALCRAPAEKPTARGLSVPRLSARERHKLHDGQRVRAMAIDIDLKTVALGTGDGRIDLVNLDESGKIAKTLNGHRGPISSLAIVGTKGQLLSSSVDRTIRLWDLSTCECLETISHNVNMRTTVVYAGGSIVCFAEDGIITIWDSPRHVPRELRHPGGVCCVRYEAEMFLSAGADGTVRVWNIHTGHCQRVLEGHTGSVTGLALNSDGSLLLSGSKDKTVRLWDLRTGLCLNEFAAHTAAVRELAWHPQGGAFVSAGEDRNLRLWSIHSGKLLRILDGNEHDALALAVDENGVVAGDGDALYRWTVRGAIPAAGAAFDSAAAQAGRQVQYTNAKVLLVGDSGAGKTGLSKRLVHGTWDASASTVGAWATQWSLPADSGNEVEREIWLWDFGGQADQRLIHQLYMDETALAILVFDAQKPNVFDSLSQWDRDLIRSKDKSLAKLLVAGRIDASPVPLRQHDIRSYVEEHGFLGYIETSARTGKGCEDLHRFIVDSIDWSNIPWRSSPVLFKRLKEEIIRVKDSGRVLMRFNELRDALKIRLPSGEVNFSDDELRAVLRLLSGPGVIIELEFGALILLQPELINAYSQAVIATMRNEPNELGCISEQRVLSGDLEYGAFERIDPVDERFVLLEMHRKLLQRGLCAKELTEKDVLLVFPTYYKRERPPLSGHPAVLVSYTFDGVVDEIYSTLVVRLDHTNHFKRKELWQDAAEFQTKGEHRIGIKLARRSGGSAAVVEVYCDPEALLAEQIIFVKYVHDHLLQRASQVVRRRHYVCPSCEHPVADLDAAEKRRNLGRDDMLCLICEERIRLFDELEKLYGSDEFQRKVRRLEGVVSEGLDNESKERLLVGEVIANVALAKQLSREKPVSDHGIDMEIEFRWDDQTASGQLLFLQLKSGDSYLRTNKDGKDIFTIKNPRHAEYWANQIAPVMLVVRESNGEIRWMEIRDFLKKKRAKGKTVKQFEFRGERFDTASLLKWRQSLLKSVRF